jgi:hypothetical protein
MLDESVQNQSLLDGAMVCSKSCLCGWVEVRGVSCSSQSLVHGGHEQLGKGGSDCNDSVFVWSVFVSFAFMYCL